MRTYGSRRFELGHMLDPEGRAQDRALQYCHSRYRIIRLFVTSSILAAAYRVYRCIGRGIFRLYCARVDSEMVKSSPDVFSYMHEIIASLRKNMDGGHNFGL